MSKTRHHATLAQFGESQLAELSTRDICASTVHLILATAFFSGAAIGFAKPLKTEKKIYLNSLRDFLETHFRLSTKNAVGMIESNARLYKRYVLIEDIYNAGMKAALDWHKDTASNNSALKNLLSQYQNLSMSGLNIEGIKEPKPAPVEVENIVPMETPHISVATPPRWGRRLFWLLFIILLGLMVFAAMFPEKIPAEFLHLLPADFHNLF